MTIFSHFMTLPILLFYKNFVMAANPNAHNTTVTLLLRLTLFTIKLNIFTSNIFHELLASVGVSSTQLPRP